MPLEPTIKTNTFIFYPPPEKLNVDDLDTSFTYTTSPTIETLIEELATFGPCVAYGWIGPRHYKAPPFQLQSSFGKVDIFGWQPGTRKHESTDFTHAIVIGAQKTEKQAYVYFTMSSDCTTDDDSNIREHHAATPARVYSSSHKTFQTYLADIYPMEQTSEPLPKK